MGRLSNHGVKQVLTPILDGLSTEEAWKSRQEAIRLLGTMAFCNPKQLAACLPQIIPKVVEAGSDPHPKVKESAKQALTAISSVIKNPEILRLSPVLLSALSDPATHTRTALEALLDCEFMHAVDTASLAILCPILGRALRDRGGDIKRKAAAITGNILTMTSSSGGNAATTTGGGSIGQLGPFLPHLLPGLKDCLVDPIPDVRATAAKALGKIVGTLSAEDIAPIETWLLATMRSDISPVERSGAGQGLAECCVYFDATRVTSLLQVVVSYRNAKDIGAREGLLWFFSFLPTCLGNAMAQYISICLPVILSGASDDDDGVREVAIRAGRVIVLSLGGTHASDMVAPLLGGIFDEDWRIRHSSIVLLGDLLALVTGTTSSPHDDDNDDSDIGMYSGSAASTPLMHLRLVLGADTANDLLASLYIIRSDSASQVRQVALSVWKSIVSNSGKAVVEIMGHLVRILVAQLSSDSEDLRLLGSRALGEVVRRQGDRILPVMIPFLQQNNAPTSGGGSVLQIQENMGQGVGAALGLTEVLAAATRKQVEDYSPLLVPSLLGALCHPSPPIRQQGGKAFLTMVKTMGSSTPCLDVLVPPLLQGIREDEEVFDFVPISSSTAVPTITTSSGEGGATLPLQNQDRSGAIMGLQELVSCRPRDLMEYLIPRLFTTPSSASSSGMSVASAVVLGAMASVPQAGNAIHYHLQEIIPSLTKELYTAEIAQESLLSNSGDPDTMGRNSEVDQTVKRAEKRFLALKAAASALMGAITSPGLTYLLPELGKQIDSGTDSGVSTMAIGASSHHLRRRKWGCWLMEMFLRRLKPLSDPNATATPTPNPISEYLPVFLKLLLCRVTDTDPSVLKAVLDALGAVATSPCLSLDTLATHISFIDNCLLSTASDARHRTIIAPPTALGATTTNTVAIAVTVTDYVLPLFTISKGPEPFLVIYLHGLMHGSVSVREQAAEAIQSLVAMCSDVILKPFLIKVTGPLIRIGGERYPSSVKVAIFTALNSILGKGGVALKAFAPQLQTTFVKGLSDPSKTARNQAILGLEKLMSLVTRIDPLLLEVGTLVSGAESGALRVSFMEAMSSILLRGGDKLTAPAPAIDRVIATILKCLFDDDENIRNSAGQLCLGVGPLASGSQLDELVTDLLEGPVGGEPWTCLVGRLQGLSSLLISSGQGKLGHRKDGILGMLGSAFQDERGHGAVTAMACRCVALLMTFPKHVGANSMIESQRAEYRPIALAAMKTFAKQLVLCSQDTSSSDIRRSALVAMKQGGKYYPLLTGQYIVEFINAAVSCLNDLNLGVKYAAERTMKHLLTVPAAPTSTSPAGPLAPSANPLQAYVSKADASSGSFVRDYATRVLTRLPEMSDDEEKISRW